jgi:exo-beta-1,3-glucanase (GH17 family)
MHTERAGSRPRRACRTPRVRLTAIGALLCLCGLAQAGPVCAERQADRPALERLRTALAIGRFVAYHPTALQIHAGRASAADPASIRADLEVLRARFDGLITYGALDGHEAIPAIARELGFRALVIGVWDPSNAAELDAALVAAHRYPQLVVGVSLGNEMLFSHRRSPDQLLAVMASVHTRAPALPLSTTEPFHIFYDPQTFELQRQLDFLMVNVHPIYQAWFHAVPDTAAAQFVIDVTHRLAQQFCGPILVKETGVPTAPVAAGFTEQRQATFYAALRERYLPSRNSAFAYFSAFDASWRVADTQASPGEHPEEAHWGLYDERRNPKAVVGQIPVLRSAGNSGIIH